MSKSEAQKRFDNNINLAKFFIKKNITKYSDIEYDDLWQTALIGLWKASVHFNGEEKCWSSFAFSCIRNEINSELWKTKEKNGVKCHKDALSIDSSYNDGSPVYNPSIEYDFDRPVIQHEVRKEMLKLSKKQRIAISMRYFQNMKIVDIAKELNCSGTNVKCLI